MKSITFLDNPKTQPRSRRSGRRNRRQTILRAPKINRFSFMRRKVRHRRARRNGGGIGSGIVGGLKSFFDKDMLLTAAGAIAAAGATRKIVNTLNESLPGLVKMGTDGKALRVDKDGKATTATDATTRLVPTDYGPIFYTLAIPAILALLVRRWNVKLAQGLAIGGLTSTAVAIIQKTSPDAAKTLGLASFREYLNAGSGGVPATIYNTPRGIAYPSAGRMNGVSAIPSNVLRTASAFSTNPWRS